MSVRIEQPGLCASVQDLGRRGHSAMGIGPAGAADALSLRVGNRLVGNDENAAAIEMTLTGATVRMQRDALVCVVGASAPEARIEHEGRSRPLPGWTPLAVRAGSRVEVGRIEGGCRVLLCVDGGIVTGEVLGSRSAHLATDIGGSALRAGEELAMGRPLRGVQVGGLSADLLQRITSRLSRRLLRQVPGAQHERFEDDARRMMVEREFTISDRSDRTGVRLDGAVIEAPGGSMRSEGVVTGAVQVPPDGKPIALLTDRPATGGYPVIGCIIGADLAALGQLRPRERVRFEWVERAWAVEDLRELEAMIASVPMPRPSGHARSHG